MLTCGGLAIQGRSYNFTLHDDQTLCIQLDDSARVLLTDLNFEIPTDSLAKLLSLIASFTSHLTILAPVADKLQKAMLQPTPSELEHQIRRLFPFVRLEQDEDTLFLVIQFDTHSDTKMNIAKSNREGWSNVFVDLDPAATIELKQAVELLAYDLARNETTHRHRWRLLEDPEYILQHQ